MDYEDLMVFHRAEKLAQAGQTQEAYMLFRRLYDKGVQNVNVLVGIAYTANDANDASNAIAVIRQMEPHHPQLSSLESMHQRKLFASGIQAGPVLHCPYCGAHAPTRYGTKTATGGWIVFVVLLICFFPLCWLGFLIHEKFYTCSRCGSRIATAS